MAGEAVRLIARRVYAERAGGGGRIPERIKPSEWEAWLQSFPWCIRGTERFAENFPLVVEHLLRPAEFRKRVLLDLLQARNGISQGYKVLADFVMRGLTRTILTTNFDTCLPEALKGRQPHIRQINEVNRWPGDYDQFNVFNRCQIVWLHGRAEQYSDKNQLGEITALDEELVERLKPIIHGSPIVVIGYRGSEPSIMDGLFGQSKQGRLDFPNGVFWCTRNGESPHPNVQSLERRLGANFTRLEIVGFDELLEGLAKELVGEDRYFLGSQQLQPSAASSFDERVVPVATLEDLDLDLALSVLQEYCRKLGRAPVTSETLTALMREQGLLVPGTTGQDSVTAGAVLVFGRQPQSIFPHAVISLTEGGKKREVYDGNLISQHRKLLARLEEEDVNPPLKVKGQRRHTERKAYPPRVLVELLVNLLVHRDYEVADQAEIDVTPGSHITFENPGAVPSQLALKLDVNTDGRFIPVEKITEQRNASLCDIFFGLSAMERAGTGLLDVGSLMLSSSGKASFFHLEQLKRFSVHVSQPQASAGSLDVARSDVPTGLYILNAIPFTVVPDQISIVRLTTSFTDRPQGLDLRSAGTFVWRGDEIWSFAPLGHLIDVLKPIVSAAVSKPRDEVEALEDHRNVLSWLLRKHWERYVDSFAEQGLMLEMGRKRRRAYFVGQDKGPRLIFWNSSQKRGNRREVVKRRGEAPRTWFENEGFGYEIVRIDNNWCVRIKPFYMFTGRDAVTPLPAFTRTSRATSRMKFDRNKSVEADLTFWSTFLARERETINVGQDHVADLILAASFITIELPEIEN